MGWSGYGLEDGDGTTSTAMSFLTKANILGKDNDILVTRQGEHSIYELMAKDYDLTDSDLVKLYKRYALALRSEIPASLLLGADLETVCGRRNNKAYYEENILVPIQMMAQIFLASQAKLPKDLLGLAKEATRLLIESSHTQDFDSPAKRRKVLRTFLAELENSDKTATRKYNADSQSVSTIRRTTRTRKSRAKAA